MCRSKIIGVLLLTLGLIGFMESNSVVMACQTDPPHQTHLDHLRGPGMGGGGSPCFNCHTGSPGQDNVDLGTCNSCHSPGGAYDGINHPDVGALNNWENIYSSEEATQSLIYESDGSLKVGKDKWCATCHDQNHGIWLDDFEGYAGDSELQLAWDNLHDAQKPVLELGSVAEGSKSMKVPIKWEKSTNDYGTVKRQFDPALDLSEADYFSFCVKLDTSKFDSVKVRLYRSDGVWSVATVQTSDLANIGWKHVSIPRTQFTNNNWALVTQLQLRLIENSGTLENVYFDNIRIFKGSTGAPNVVGDNVTYGYYVTGHGFRDCTWCHDSTSPHIDGQSRPVLEYIDDVANPTNFRFYDDPSKQLRLPYSYNNTPGYASEDFALCYWCHSESNLVGDEWYSNTTNFVDGEDGHICGMSPNLHYLHVKMMADDPWPSSCVHCHDPHGHSHPAMTRVEMGEAIYFDGDGCEIVDRQVDRNSNGVADWYESGFNGGLALQSGMGAILTPDTGGQGCDNPGCHSPSGVIPPNCGNNPYTEPECLTDGFYLRTYEVLPHTGGMDVGPDCFTAGCHAVSQNHATHFVSDKGPRIPQDETGCYVCHAAGNLQCGPDAPLFADDPVPQPLATTTVCDGCHSPGGP